ncbi:MAG: hypothetical protein KGO02_07150 [Alphaproteobacteria bacterium]|nr:hypothetical protein [Alphaproteobacteria bacterium]
MNVHKAALGFLAVASFCASSSFAKPNTWTMIQTGKPFVASYPGASLDIIGIKLGMSVGDVEKVLTSHYHTPPQSQMTTMPVDYRTIFMNSQNYTRSLTFRSKCQQFSSSKCDIIWVYFGTPATGNSVIKVTRQLSYHQGTGPTVQQSYATLDKKYGPESAPSRTDNGSTLYWVFGKRGHVSSCPNKDCSCGYNEMHMVPKNLVSQDELVCVMASFSGKDYSVTIRSPAAEYVDELAAKREVQGVGIAAYKKEVQAHTPPKRVMTPKF